jgi:hypothetical protein
MSVDPSGNIELSEQLRKLRLMQFSNYNENIKELESHNPNMNNSSNVGDTNKTQNTQSDDTEYFNNSILYKHRSFKEHQEIHFDKKCKDIDKEQQNHKPSLSSLNNSNLVKNASIQNQQSNNEENLSSNSSNKVQFNFINAKPIQQQISNQIPGRKDDDEFQLTYNGNLSKKSNFSTNSLQTNNSNAYVLKNQEQEFRDSLFSLKQVKSIEEESAEGFTETELKSMLKLKNQNDTQTKIKNAFKKRQQAYKILLMNKYTEAKYNRITICGLALILTLVLLFFVYFSESAKNYFIQFISQINIEFE